MVETELFITFYRLLVPLFTLFFLLISLNLDNGNSMLLLHKPAVAPLQFTCTSPLVDRLDQ
jgi:hypothetical protein